MSSRPPESRGKHGRDRTPPGGPAEPLHRTDEPAIAREAETHSVGNLLRQLAHEIPELMLKELALARAELGESIKSTRNGIISLVSGAAVLIPGVFVLLMAAVFGLGMFMALWLSALIVGAIVTVIGIAMVVAGKKKLEAENLKPEGTLHQMERDKESIKGASHERTTTH